MYDSLDTLIASANRSVTTLHQHTKDLTTECHSIFSTIRQSLLKALEERENKLCHDIQHVVHQREHRLENYRMELSKQLNYAKAAREESLKIVNSQEVDLYAIKALTDAKTALKQPLPIDPEQLKDGQVDILFKCKPRELIRTMETQIASKSLHVVAHRQLCYCVFTLLIILCVLLFFCASLEQGGIIASLPLPCTFVSFICVGTSVTLSWSPATPPQEGETFDYVLEVCELPRNWRAELKRLQPSLFPQAWQPHEELEDERWSGEGQLLAQQRANINWTTLAPSVAINLGGNEMCWRVVGGAQWTGQYVPLYRGEQQTVKHENVSITNAYIYRVAVKNELGISEWTYSHPCTLPCTRLSYSWDMDSNGLVSYLGSAGGTSTWSCPANTWVHSEASSVQLGDANTLLARQATTFQTLNRHLSWVKFDLGHTQPFRLLVTHYTLANCGRGPASKRPPRSWLLQGSEDNLNWVTLKEHVKDTAISIQPNATASWSVNPPSNKPYRYFRILQTDLNAAQDHQLALGQMELYGWLVRDEMPKIANPTATALLTTALAPSPNTSPLSNFLNSPSSSTTSSTQLATLSASPTNALTSTAPFSPVQAASLTSAYVASPLS